MGAKPHQRWVGICDDVGSHLAVCHEGSSEIISSDESSVLWVMRILRQNAGPGRTEVVPHTLDLFLRLWMTAHVQPAPLQRPSRPTRSVPIASWQCQSTQHAGLAITTDPSYRGTAAHPRRNSAGTCIPHVSARSSPAPASGPGRLPRPSLHPAWLSAVTVRGSWTPQGLSRYRGSSRHPPARARPHARTARAAGCSTILARPKRWSFAVGQARA